MTTAQAAKKWGYTIGTIQTYCEKGLVEGAEKRKKRGYPQPVWYIPDDAPKPNVRFYRNAKRKKDDVEEPPPMRAGRMPDPCGMADIDYVWKYQEYSIRELAKKLGISSKRVVLLYEQAFKRWKGRSKHGV